jgi:FkbM family methyltransferase
MTVAPVLLVRPAWKPGRIASALMARSLRSRLEESSSSLLARAGRFASRVGNKLTRMSVNASPWRHASDSRTGRPVDDQIVDRARHAGYVKHGEFGIKLAYDEDIVSPTLVERIARGRYERYEGRFSRQFVVDGDRVIELGAGLGFLSALLMSTIKVDDYQLVEADPRLAEVISRTHQLNDIAGPCTIRSCVATCDPELLSRGEVPFHIGEAFCTSSLLGAKKPIQTVTVPVVSLPEMISEHRSNVLIADIEGSEAGVFNGTPLGSIERILMEIHPHRIRDDGVRRIFRDLDELGFVYDINVSAGRVLGFRRVA